MKNTSFTLFHESLGAKMHPFAGYNMPIEYSGIIDEHLNVLQNAGVFDVSHMGEIWVKGPAAFSFLQKVTSNDVAKLTLGKAQYTCFVNEKGGIADDLILYFYEEEKYLLVVNASNIDKDWAWLHRNNTEGAILENSSEKTALLAIQGPKAIEILQQLTPVDLSKIPYYSFVTGTLAGVNNVIISNTGYTGAGGFELYFYNDFAETIWNALFKAGEGYGIKPAGLGARDTLRLEMGYPLYGNELTDDTSPLEAGLSWITKFKTDKNFIGKSILQKEKETGSKRKLVAFMLSDRGIPRTGYEIANEEGEIIGNVTSGTMSPVLKKGIGLGYVQAEYAQEGTTLFVKIRNKDLRAIVCTLPFRK